MSKHAAIWVFVWSLAYLFVIQNAEAQERVSVPQSEEQVVLSKSAYADMIYLLCSKHAAVVSYQFLLKQTEKPADAELERVKSQALTYCYKWVQSEYKVKELFRS